MMHLIPFMYMSYNLYVSLLPMSGNERYLCYLQDEYLQWVFITMMVISDKIMWYYNWGIYWYMWL
jgi:hypothetical protein